MVPRQQKYKGEIKMSMKYWYYTEGNNAGSSYTDFTSMNNGSASGYTDFTGFGNSYADRNSESFRSGYNDYSGFGSDYTDFTQPAQSAYASDYTGYNAGYAAAGTQAHAINRSVRQAPTFLKANVEGTKKKKGAGKVVIGVFATVAVLLGAALGAYYFMNNSDNFLSNILNELGSKASAVPSEIPLGQEGFAKYTTPTKKDKSSNGGAKGAANGAAAGAANGEHRDVYDIADSILEWLKCDNDVETARAIFNWVHTNVYYQTIGHSQTYEEAAYMGFTKKTGDCYVYFSCAKMLLDRAEIPNLMVKRYPVKKSAHFWNLVQLDGKWYHCDATVYKDHPEMYFMCTDDEIGDKYHQFDKSLYPERATKEVFYPDDEIYQPGEYGDVVDYGDYGDDYNAPFVSPSEGPAQGPDVDYEDYYSDDF